MTMYFTKVMLLFCLGILSLNDVQAQVAMGDYSISGTANIGSDAINLNIKALKIGSEGPTAIPASTTAMPSPVPGGASKSASDEVYRGLEKHNAHREIHNAPPMTLSTELNNNAQDYAKHLADSSLFEHSPNLNDEGENLGLQCTVGTESDGELVEKVVDDWYMEVCKYDFNNPGFSWHTGHFTQVVWKDSTQLGIGFARGSYTFGTKTYDNCLFVVGRYRPRGNMKGDFPNNVAKGSFNKAETCSNNAGKRNKLTKKFLNRINGNKQRAHKRIFTLVL